MQKRGGEILGVRKSATIVSAAYAIRDHLRDWCFGSDEKWVSMGIFSDGSYGVPKGVVFSMPVICKKGFEYELVRDLPLNEFQEKRIQASVEQLNEERSESGVE